MRRAVIAALAAVLLTTWPVQAQLFPSGPGSTPPAEPAARVLLDTTLYVNPPTEEDLCMVLDAGQVTVTAKRLSTPIEPRPASFRLRGFMADPEANATLTINDVESSVTLPVKGIDRYCWSVSVDAPDAQGLSMAQRGAYVQRIALRITLAP